MTDEKHEHSEPVDTDVAKCPYCGSFKIHWAFTARGIAFKCMACGKDSHFWQDVGVAGAKHREKELEALPILKRMFPQLIFVENIPIDAEPITGEGGDQEVRYDAGVCWFSTKIAKIKITVLRNQTQRHYIYEAIENYIQGREKVFEYLSKIDCLMLFYFPDEKDETQKLAIASCREIKKFAIRVTDRFANEQYSLPLDVRKAIIKTDQKSFKDLLFRNLIDHINENLYII